MNQRSDQATVIPDDATRLRRPDSAPTVVPVAAPGPAHEVTRLRADDDRATIATSRQGAAARREPEASLGLLKDRFVLEKILGAGGMGVVYRATDLRKREAGDEDAAIAVKVLSRDFSGHPDALVALQREAKKAQLLAHPNVITVYDFDRDGDTVFMTMELLSGESLRSYLERCAGRAQRRTEQLSIIRQLALGLRYAHSKGLVHCDLKPDNIFLTDKGQVKILDFGIARACSDEYYRDHFDAGELGAYTPRYASPGIVQGSRPEPGDDVYALGLIACELLGGRHPYRSRDAVAAREAGEQPELPARVNLLLRHLLKDTVALDGRQAVPTIDRFLRRLGLAMHWRRYAAASAAAVCLLAGTNAFLAWHYQDIRVSFDELPPASQAKVLEYLSEADTALGFDDVNGALLYLDKAYTLHPDNDQVAQRVDAVLARIRRFAEEHPERRASLVEQIKDLEGYGAVRGNDAYYQLTAALAGAVCAGRAASC